MRTDFGDTVGLTPLMPMYTLGHNFVPPPVHARRWLDAVRAEWWFDRLAAVSGATSFSTLTGADSRAATNRDHVGAECRLRVDAALLTIARPLPLRSTSDSGTRRPNRCCEWDVRDDACRIV